MAVTGEPRHCFADPADGQPYTYSSRGSDACRSHDLEQPDLKSTFTLTVNTPRVGRSSTRRPPPRKRARPGSTLLATTEVMSTYTRSSPAPTRARRPRSPPPTAARPTSGAPALTVEHLDADETTEITRQLRVLRGRLRCTSHRPPSTTRLKRRTKNRKPLLCSSCHGMASTQHPT